jgi:uncharacterized protein (DUF983 family)
MSSSDSHDASRAHSRERTPFWRASLRAVLRNRCPHCGETRLFTGYYTMQRRCAVCDIRYEAESGAWLGALALGYGIGALVAIVLAWIEVLWGPIRDLGLPPMWTIAVTALLATLAGYRPAKAAWFVLLYHYGFMAFGDEPAGPWGRGQR